MTNLKRTLTPIRLAIPSLLALSATAAWSPQITTSGTGFYADAGSLPFAGAQYDRPGVQINTYSYSGYYPCGGGGIQYDDAPDYDFGDLKTVVVLEDHPTACVLVGSITDFGSGTGYASLTWQ